LIDQSIINIDDVLRQGFEQTQGSVGDVQTALREGFNAAEGTLSSAAQNIMGIASTLDAFDTNTQSQFAEISSAFDAQGNLIQQSTDQVGNTIIRQMDDQGNLITQKIDSNGNVIGQSQTNINDAIRAIQTQTGSLTDRVTAGFQGVTQGQQDLSQQGQGIMAEQTDQRNRLQNQMAQITSGFNMSEQQMDTQIRDLARVAATQTDIDMARRQDFKQIGDAFDDQGRLIRNSVLDNGTTISRAIDDNGNLLLRAFDNTGQAIGDKVININRSLNDLAQLPFMAGGNVNMGVLSPAMKAPQQGGFMSPYSQTRG